MVKGNAERRKELSVLRREAKKAEVRQRVYRVTALPRSLSVSSHLNIGVFLGLQGERKLGGSMLATPGEARARLLNDAKTVDGGEEGLTGWTLANVGGGGGGGGDDGEDGVRKEKRK